MKSSSSIAVSAATPRYGAVVPAPPRTGWRNLRTSLPLLLTDVVVLVCVGGLGLLGCTWCGVSPSIVRRLWLESLLAVPMGFLLFGLYPACGMTAANEFRQVVRVAGSILGTLTLSHGIQAGVWTGFYAMALALFAVVLIASARGSVRRWLAKWDWWAQPVLIFGDKQRGGKIYEQMLRNRRSGLRPAQLYDLDSIENQELTREELIQSLTVRHKSDRAILVDLPQDVEVFSQPGRGIPYVNVAMTSVSKVPALWATTCERAGSLNIEFQDRLLCWYCRALKRSIDLAIAICLLPFIGPLLLVLAMLVKLSSPGPAFYRQRRIGFRGKRFSMWKLRTMVPDADQVLHAILEESPDLREEWENSEKLKNDPRIFPVGNLLRKTSLDELPQLLNVLTGDMSLVGPRPIPDKRDSIRLYTESFPVGGMASYEATKPGITGLWQISGRNNTTPEERSAFDDYYARNWSPWLDLYILVRTIKTVIFQEGAY